MPDPLVLNATQWEYQSDLNSPPGRWSCEFVETKPAPSHAPDEIVSRQGHTRVALDVHVQDQVDRLTEGIVREWGFRETPNGVVATASGLDLKARLLDFKPSRKIEFRGVFVLGVDDQDPPGSGGTPITLGTKCDGTPIRAVFFETFQSVASLVCAEAGFTSSFDCYNYVLGQDIVWETDRSANDVLSQLVAPFNATERHKIDVFVDPNDVVRFVERGRTPPSVVEIDYLQLSERDIAEFRPPAVNDVQVIGATHAFTEPDCGHGQNPTEGAIFAPNGVPEPYVIVQRSEERESYDITTPSAGNPLTGSFDVLVSETTSTKYFNVQAQLTRHVINKRYVNYVIREPSTGVGRRIDPRIRFEDSDSQFEYNGPHDEMTRMARNVGLRDLTEYNRVDEATAGRPIVLDGIANINQIIEREESETAYDKGGDPIHVVSKTYRAEEPRPTTSGAAQSSGLMLEREVEMWYAWSRGQRLRFTATRHFSREVPGFLLSASTVTEPATGRGRPTESAFLGEGSQGPVGTWGPLGSDITTSPSVFPLVRSGNVRQGTLEIKSGPDTSQTKQAFAVLGLQADADYFRGRILSELASLRYEGNFTMLPDLNVREGWTLRVVNAPARWRTNEFYLVSREARHTDVEMVMRLRAVAWL